MNVKVITIKQPWASLIVNGYKEYEFRSWKTKYRGKIYIHAGKSFDKNAMKRASKYNLDYQFGCIIGCVDITDCIEVTHEFESELIKKDETVYGMHRNRSGFAFKLENPQKIDPIYVNGKLGIWKYKSED